jgi:vacuolar-type H+-ATPase subunit H
VTDSRMKDRMKGLLVGAPPEAENPEQTDTAPQDTSQPRHALQVLTLAQRTADEHLADAHREAEKIHADAQEAAARAARDAEARTQGAQRDADKILSDAQAKAEAIAADGQANAEDLKLQAEQRYQDVVGGLAAKREGLQQQIEALEQFDREYRTRLVAFMQGQLRALWVDEPQVTGEIEQPGSEAASGPARARRPASAAKAEPQ